MLVVHRVTPFFSALAVALGMAAPLWVPVHPVVSLGIALIIAFCLLSHLGGWKFQEPRFWFLMGSPFMLVCSSYTLALFLENDLLKMGLGAVTALLVFFFAEHLFTFLHLSAAYQMRAIEHVSLVVNVVSFFFASASLFGFRLFLSLPLLLLAPVCFLASLFLLASTLWICKVERHRLLPYAFGGALMSTEFFVAMSFLPSGFFTNAALLSIFFYLYLGLSRASVLQKLSPVVMRRYLAVSIFLVIVVVSTARWD